MSMQNWGDLGIKEKDVQEPKRLTIVAEKWAYEKMLQVNPDFNASFFFRQCLEETLYMVLAHIQKGKTIEEIKELVLVGKA